MKTLLTVGLTALAVATVATAGPSAGGEVAAGEAGSTFKPRRCDLLGGLIHNTNSPPRA